MVLRWNNERSESESTSSQNFFPLDYPEHFRAGLTPHGPRDRYYFARGPQLVNRVVDIGPYIDSKVWVNMANVTQGPAGNNGAARRTGSNTRNTSTTSKNAVPL